MGEKRLGLFLGAHFPSGGFHQASASFCKPPPDTLLPTCLSRLPPASAENDVCWNVPPEGAKRWLPEVGFLAISKSGDLDGLRQRDRLGHEKADGVPDLVVFHQYRLLAVQLSEHIEHIPRLHFCQTSGRAAKHAPPSRPNGPPGLLAPTPTDDKWGGLPSERIQSEFDQKDAHEDTRTLQGKAGEGGRGRTEKRGRVDRKDTREP